MSTLKTVSVIHPSGSVTNISNDSSGNVTIGNNLTVTGTSSFTGSLGNITTGTINSGNITSTGTVAATTGTLYPIVSGTAITLTNQTAPGFTGIPSWVKRVTLMFDGVSTNGTSNYLVQLGSTTYTTSGYKSWSNFVGSSTGGSTSTAGFINPSGGGTNVQYGHYIFTLITGNTWVCSFTLGVDAAGTAFTFFGGGSVALGGALDRIRLNTVNGTDQYDAGTVNIFYE